MDSPLSPEGDTLTVASETSSPDHLLESGFRCMQQGRYIEGGAFFTLACERLSPNQTHLSAALETFLESYKAYLKIQEELFRASKHFAKAEAELQVQIAALTKHLPVLPEETNKISPKRDELQQSSQDNLLLDVPRTSPEGCNGHQLSKTWPVGTAQDTMGNQSSLSPSDTEDSATLPGLYITCFGRFEMKRLDRPVVLCSNRHGQTILRYLVAQAGHCATSDKLMTLLWPEDELEVAQPRLHTSICALRRSLNAGYASGPGGGYIVCKNRNYGLNTAIPIKTDVDQFLHYHQKGRQANEERITCYERACLLYTGPFLPEDKYADWSFLQREHLGRVYIDMCRVLTNHYLEIKCYEEAERWATAVLKEDHCNELAYQQLMQIYAAQGHRKEAFLQYQRCERVLREELAMSPTSETVDLMQTLLKNNPSSAR